MKKKILTLAVLICITLSQAQIINVATWNVESGDTRDSLIQEQLASHDGIDIWGLTEVTGVLESIIFEQGAEQGENANFESVLGTTGRADKLQIIYDADRFRLITDFEIDAINLGDLRAPLVAHFEERESGLEFIFMVNHLARGDEAKRYEQAQLLNIWAQAQTLPIINVGDFNFDWDVINGEQNHDPAYDAFVANNIYTWVRPETLVRTQCSARGDSCRYNSVLDFVFTAGTAQNWIAVSSIYVEDGDFPDNSATSDHRPVFASFAVTEEMTDTQDDEALVESILRRIENIAREIDELREIIQQLFSN